MISRSYIYFPKACTARVCDIQGIKEGNLISYWTLWAFHISWFCYLVFQKESDDTRRQTRLFCFILNKDSSFKFPDILLE